MVSYKFIDVVKATWMEDGSGYALYNGYTGNTAFLHSQSPELLTHPSPPSFNLSGFTAQDIGNILGLSEAEVAKMLDWLIRSDFIQVIQG